MHLGNSDPCKFVLEQTEEVNEAKLSAVLKIRCASKVVRSSKGQVLWQKSRIKSWELSSLMVSYIFLFIQSMVMDCFCGNRKGWYQNYDVNEWIFIYLLIHSQGRIRIGNLEVTSIRISLKRTKKNGSMCWQRALHIFWQDSNNESKASCSLACFLFPFSSPKFSISCCVVFQRLYC